MPPFRFNIPFFSYGSPSRLSSRTSSSSSPSPPPSRPPFRPAGIAQPSSQETKSKVPPSSLSRVKSNVAAIADSLTTPTSSSRGAATRPRVEKQSNQSDSPSKKAESLGAMEKEKPPITSSERKEEEEAQEQRKKTEAENLVAQERISKSAQEQHKAKETEKLVAEGKKKVLFKETNENSKTSQEQQRQKESEKLAMEEKKKILPKDMGETSKTSQEQQKRKETEKLAVQERNRALHTVGKEDARPSKTTRHIIAASSESIRDQTERKLRNRDEIHTDGNQQKAKGESTSNLANPSVSKGDGSSLMSRRIKEDIRDGLSKLTCGKSNGDENPVSVFTLTGENRGATMAIGSEKKESEVHIRRGYLSNPDESPNTSASESQGERKSSNSQNPRDREGKEEARVEAYVNGNTQAINNSIICESSVVQNDPGVHMSFRFEESKKEVMNPPEKKAETATKQEPRVRRRCLRGLLAESSESDNNPLKPRRHGCRFTCKDKDIENT